jgi:hypothetical protein
MRKREASLYYIKHPDQTRHAYAIYETKPITDKARDEDMKLLFLGEDTLASNWLTLGLIGLLVKAGKKIGILKHPDDNIAWPDNIGVGWEE